MSGHSRWSQIKHKKAITDAKRGKIFTLLGNAITLAAREGGDPASNFKLKAAIEKARAENMPMQNIDRAIKRGTGELLGAAISENTYEAFGPSGTALLIKTISDNKNRTISEIRNILTRFGGKLASGGVSHLFETKGIIKIETRDRDREELELAAIDAGVEDIEEQDNTLTIYTKPQDLFTIKNNLEKQGIKIERAELSLEPKALVKIDDEKKADAIVKLMNALEESDDVSSVYANFDIPDELINS